MAQSSAPAFGSAARDTYAGLVPRAVQPQTPAAVAPEAGALAIHKSKAQLRLDALEIEHERLLREITKKRALREVVEQEVRDTASAMAAKVMPIREAIGATLRDLQAIFAGLLGDDSRLNRRDKARVRRLYARILPDLARERDARDERDENDPSEQSPWEGREPDDDSESGYSANKPSEKNASLLRALFRKLAVALHPDKVQDEGERATLTSVMKEVTRAYESGDVARLVEIERTWLAQGPVEVRESDIEQRITELLAANKELRRQARALTAELKELKQSVPGLAAPRRRGARSRALRSELDEMISEMDRELGQLRILRDFAQGFANGEMDLAEFLLGPELPEDDAEDPFEQMLAEVLEAMAEAPRAQRGRRRKRR